jgi:hypothetical protein
MAVKGQWRTFEAVLAGIVILLFLAALTSVNSVPATGPPAQGYRALRAVYDEGLLRPYAATLDTGAIDASAAATGYLRGFSHAVVICNATSCTGNAPGADTVWASSIIVSGDSSYAPAEVILYIYR